MKRESKKVMNEPKLNLTTGAQHSSDCTLYAALENNRPIDGICTCGYGWSCARRGDWSAMYSLEYLLRQSKPPNLLRLISQAQILARTGNASFDLVALLDLAKIQATPFREMTAPGADTKSPTP